MTFRQKIAHIVIHGFMLLVMVFGYVPDAFALGLPTPPAGGNELPVYVGVESSLREYLCTPDMGGFADTILFDCIGKLYRFGVAFGSIALVFFLVMGGYLYIVGGETGKQKAKGVIISALTGMAIILTSYLLLSFINPDLTKFKSINPPVFIDPGLPSCEDIGYTDKCDIKGGPNDGKVYIPPGGGGGGGKRCSPASSASPASVENLSKSCFGQYGADVVKQASIVAQSESGGNPALPVSAGSCGPGKNPARCTGGEIPVWGLFQINLTVHKVGGLNCPAAFGNKAWTCSNTCTVTNKALYNQCVDAAKNPTNNINAACVISQQCLASGRPRFCAWGNTSNEHGKRCGF